MRHLLLVASEPLKQHVLAQVDFPVYLWCTLPFSLNTMHSPQRAPVKSDLFSRVIER
jgi:hypothetical protein